MTTGPSGRRPLSAVERVLAAIFVLGVVWSVWSYTRGGIVYAVIAAATDSERSLDLIRGAVERAGVFGPAAYVLAVVIEVLVAPIPGTLLYAPAGAIFGGFWGGTLSLSGNVIGATAATWLARTFGARLLGVGDRPKLRRLSERIRARGLLVVTLLRLNPLTSSDLVSYAAGLVGVRIWRVALGTALGMAPLCYLQAYASEWLLEVVPGSGLVVLALGVAYVGVVVWIVAKTATAPRP